MFEILFAAIGSGLVIMTCLFLYWFKYIYEDKDAKNNRGQYTPLAKEAQENDVYYQVDPNFLQKRKKKRD